MKRVFLLIVLVTAVSLIITSHRSSRRRDAGSRDRDTLVSERRGHERAPRRPTADARRETQRALAEARKAVEEAREAVHHSLDEVRDDVHEAVNEALHALATDLKPPKPPVAPVPPAVSEKPAELREPIAHNAQPAVPEAADTAGRVEKIGDQATNSNSTAEPTVTGQLSATEDRAVADARRKLQGEIAAWIQPEVPTSWAPPAGLIDAMIVAKPQIKVIKKDYGDLFQARLTFNRSPQQRTTLIEAYNRQLVDRRLGTLGGTLAFVLICLAAVTGYIRADEATKGYYTNRLRMLTAAGVGTAGVILYNMVA